MSRATANSDQRATLVRAALRRGVVIPACPLALSSERRFDERRQRCLFRYYAAAGAGGVAVGVHTTQFAIRHPRHALLKPLLELAGEEMDRADAEHDVPLIRVAGVCGRTAEAVAEATSAAERGFEFGLLSLAAMDHADEASLVAHCREVAQVLPLFGFYLQPAVGGRLLPYSFWREFAEIENVAAIKIACFNRYQTLDVMRAVAESGRNDIALYTGNDDNIVFDLVTPYRFRRNGEAIERRMVGGLLGQWAVWTRRAVELLEACHRAANEDHIPAELLRRQVELTDANAAIFDAANGFVGCIPGIHEILHRQGLLISAACLDPAETASVRQIDEIDRVCRSYPYLSDDEFVREHLNSWLSD